MQLFLPLLLRHKRPLNTLFLKVHQVASARIEALLMPIDVPIVRRHNHGQRQGQHQQRRRGKQRRDLPQHALLPEAVQRGKEDVRGAAQDVYSRGLRDLRLVVGLVVERHGGVNGRVLCVVVVLVARRWAARRTVIERKPKSRIPRILIRRLWRM